MAEKQQHPLWRVWMNGRWALVRAETRDDVYKSFRPARRAQIVRVDLVRKTSEVLAEREES